MKKIVSLTVLTTLLAGCMGTDSTTPTTTTYGYDGFSEEKLLTTESTDTLNNTYLLAAGPKYHIGTPYKIGDIQYIPGEDMAYNQTGMAGIIPTDLDGQKTSNGETYSSSQLLATSKTLPLPSVAKVTNLDNGKTVTVRINNRGPFVNTRILDLSAAAAKQIDMKGATKVQVQILQEQSTMVKNATLGTTTEQATVAPATETVATGTGEYSIQVAAVYSEDNAKMLADKLSAYGKTTVVNEGDMYKVRLIDLDPSTARSLIDELRNKEGMAPGLLKNGKWVNADSI